jgi:hypothetical protein
MAAPKIASGAGLRHVRYYTIDTDGYPDGSQTGSDGYPGVRIEGVKTFTANIPDPQTIRHTGDDRVFAQDSLPPTELETATITTGKTNLTVDAELSNTLVQTLDDLQIGLASTDQQGFEPSVCVMGFRQALNTTDGASPTREYITHMYCSTRVIPKGGTMAEQTADENAYNLIPTPVGKFPWGTALATVTNGATEAVKVKFISENPLMMERFTAPGAVTTFLLDYTPISAVKTHVWVDGVAATVSSVSTANKTFTLSVAPSAASVVVALYETTDLT